MEEVTKNCSGEENWHRRKYQNNCGVVRQILSSWDEIWLSKVIKCANFCWVERRVIYDAKMRIKGGNWDREVEGSCSSLSEVTLWTGSPKEPQLQSCVSRCSLLVWIGTATSMALLRGLKYYLSIQDKLLVAEHTKSVALQTVMQQA